MEKSAENLKKDIELAIMRAKDTLRDDLTRAHSRELETRELGVISHAKELQALERPAIGRKRE